MYCDSKQRGNRSSARGAAQVRRSALHRPDPRRPLPIYARATDILLQFVRYDGKARSPS